MSLSGHLASVLPAELGLWQVEEMQMVLLPKIKTAFLFSVLVFLLSAR